MKSIGSEKMEDRKREEAEGYLYCIPYVGDRWILSEKTMTEEEIVDTEKIRNIEEVSKDLGDYLLKFYGKRIRIRIEEV